MQRQLAEWCPEVDGQGSNTGDKDPGGSHGITARFQTQFETIATIQTNMREPVPSSLGDVFFSSLVHSKEVAGRLEECRDAKDATQVLVSLTDPERNELRKSCSFSKNRVESLPAT